MRKIIKKTDYCSNCGFLDTNNYCRRGLGWDYIPNPSSSYCLYTWPIRPKRCGTCRWFVIDESDTDSDTSHRFCKRSNLSTNFYNYCPLYEYERGKNIRPKADEIPSNLKILWQQ